jgi:hypothetical protein
MLPGVDDAVEVREMLALAAAVCPDSAAFLAPRLRRYGAAITARDERGLAAFELIDRFEERGERFVYLGPLFSRDGACVPMFCEFFEGLLAVPGPVHLMVEVQNPEVAVLFKNLFPSRSFPAFAGGPAPASIAEVAETFARRLDHIHGLDRGRLRTRGDDSLFRPRPGCEPVVRWMESRGVSLKDGDCQVFVVSCGGEEEERRRLRTEVGLGLTRFRDWRRWRPRVVELFEPAAVHA